MHVPELISGARYRVEVSGWDENLTYFVEKSDLASDELAGKHLSLQHKLSDGAIVFVRVLQATTQCQAPPAAYRVEFVSRGPDGCHQFRLDGVQPRYSRKGALN